MWNAWHDMDNEPYATGTEVAMKELAKTGASEGDYVEDEAGRQYGWNATTGQWDKL